MSNVTRPEVPIDLDVPRTLKLDWNAIAECKRVCGIGFYAALAEFGDYEKACVAVKEETGRKMAALGARRDQTDSRWIMPDGLPAPELTGEELARLEIPARAIRALVWALLSHQWLKSPPQAPELTPTEVGAMFDLYSVPLITAKIGQALEGNAKPPGPAQEGANGQSPLSLTVSQTGTPSPQ